MAEKQASWIQASSHPADTDRLVLEGLMNPAGVPVSGAGYGVGTGPTELQVTQNGTPNMSVNVAAGHAWIDGTESATQGAYHGYNDATKNLVIAASDPTNPRKDLVVAKAQDAAYSGAVNAWSLVVVTGTPAASPAEPAVPANGVVLALVDVAALATTVTNANITDRRRRACGFGGLVVCTSSTRPTSGLYEGLHIYETDTDRVLTYDGAAWAWPKNTAGGTLAAPQGVPGGIASIALGFGTTETLYLASTAIATLAGRRYSISGYLSWLSGGTPNNIEIRVRQGNGTGGSVVGFGRSPKPAAGANSTVPFYATDVPGAQAAQQWSVTYKVDSSTADLYQPTLLVVQDIGAA